MKSLSPLLGIVLVFAIDIYCSKKYGYPSLSILIAKASVSKHFKWLTWNVWGDDSRFYKKVLSRMDGA